MIYLTLIEALKNEDWRVRRSFVRGRVAWELGWIRAAEAVSALVEGLKDENVGHLNQDRVQIRHQQNTTGR